MKKRLHILVSGVVQGVFFRHNTRITAISLGLTGWVRNLADGKVEILAEGEETELEKLASWARKGPEGSRVEDIRKQWEEYKGEYRTFSVTY